MKRKITFNKGKVGKKAYLISRVWGLGFHAFSSDNELIFRLCYLRNNKGTHYIQFTIKIRNSVDCAGD